MLISYIAEELGEGKRPKIKPNLGAGIEWEKSANKTKFVPRKLGSGTAGWWGGQGGLNPSEVPVLMSDSGSGSARPSVRPSVRPWCFSPGGLTDCAAERR